MQRFKRYLPLVLIAMSAIIFLLPAARPSINVAMGSEGEFLVEGQTQSFRNFYGFKEVERTEQGTFRWTGGRGSIAFPYWENVEAPLQIRMLICGCRTDGQTMPLTVTVNQQRLLKLTLSNQWQWYQVQLPANLTHPDHDILLDLTSEEWQSPDQRTLGIVVQSIQIEALAAQPAQALWAWLGLALGLGLMVLWEMPFGFACLVFGQWLLGFYGYQPQFLPKGFLLTSLVLANVLGWQSLRKLPQLWRWIALPISSFWLISSPQILGSWILDDAFISFRYAANLANGHGLVFNFDERVEGFTNFLWTLLSSLTIKLGADPILVTHATNLLLGMVIVLLSLQLAYRLHQSAWMALVAPLMLLNLPLLLYTSLGSGMETALFCAGILATVLLAINQAWVYAAITTTLTIMIRPDGILLAGIIGLLAIWQSWRAKQWQPLLRYAGILTLTFIPYWLARWWYYGYPLPNTFYAKVGGTAKQAERGINYFIDFNSSYYLGWLGLGLGLVASGLRWFRSKQLPLLAIVTWAIVGFYTSYTISVGGDWMPGYRFMVATVPWFALLASWGISELWQYRRWLGAGAIVATTGLLVLLLQPLRQDRPLTIGSAAWYETDVVNRYREVGLWINDSTPADTTLTVTAAGAIPYYAERTTIDAHGLTDLHIAHIPIDPSKAGKPGHEKQDPDYVLRERKPSLIPWVAAPMFTSHPLFEPNYRLIEASGSEGRGIRMFVRRDSGLFEQ